MLALASSLHDQAEVLHLQSGSLRSLLKAAGLKSSTYNLPPDLAGFKRKNTFASVFRIVPSLLAPVLFLRQKCREYDVIVCMSQKSFLLASLSNIWSRKPLVWYMNDLVTKEHFSAFSIKMMIWLSKFSADHIVFNSNASRNAWLKAGGHLDKTLVSYSGVNTGEISTDLEDTEAIARYRAFYSPAGEPLIGTFGRLTPWKGQEIFIKAIAKLPHVHAIVVGGALFGENAFEASLRKLAYDLGIDKRIHFLGNSNDIFKLMAACDVVAHCSTAPEPFGRTIAEAMMTGTPVVATNAGGAKEIITDGVTGQLIEPGNEELLARSIEKYLSGGEWTMTVARQARDVCTQKFSSLKMIEDFIWLLEKYR